MAARLASLLQIRDCPNNVRLKQRMEPSECLPFMSPNLALELLRAPPAPIPVSDPLLFGRRWMLNHKPPGDASDVEDVHEPSPPSSLSLGNANAGHQTRPATPLSSSPTSACAASGQSGPALQRGPTTGYRQLPCHVAADLSYDEFVRRYMEPNQPVVIRGVTSGWRAAAEWRTANGRLRLEVLLQLAGHCCVCVTDTSDQDDGCGVVRTMRLSEYLAWWTRHAAATQQHQQQQTQKQQQQQFHQQQQQQQQQQTPRYSAEPLPPLAATAWNLPTEATAMASSPGVSGGAASHVPDPEHRAERARERQGCDWEDGRWAKQLEATTEEGPAGPGTHPLACGAAQAAAQPLPFETAAAAAAAPIGMTAATAAATTLQCVSGPAACGEGLMYLKDWHFVAEFPDYGAYRLPVFFADDWLNAYYDRLVREESGSRGEGVPTADNPPTACNGDDMVAAAAAAAAVQGNGGTLDHQPSPPGTDAALIEPKPPPALTSDYRFCYLGPAGTWTPLHSDVLRSYSWSANVCGCKRWLMLHPRYTHLLYDRQMLRMAPHLELDRVHSSCDPGDFPGLDEARRHAFEFIQEEGDAVFVPSGWHHCVENLYDTLSINHNWINGHNCHWTWALLRQQYVDAASAIEDCRQLCPPDEFEDLVQANLAANMGLNWHGFVDLLACTVHSALGLLRAREPVDASGSMRSGCPARAVDGGQAVMSALLALQRAGFLLKEYISSFEELVLAPAERRDRPSQHCGCEKAACDRLRQIPTIRNAKSLLSCLEDELRERGLDAESHH